jgi:hypothetical protein
LNQIYSFPGDWSDPPRVYRLVPGWEETVLGEGGALRLDSTTVLAPPSLYGEVESRRVIFLIGSNGLLERAQGPLVIAGRELPLKPFVTGPSAEPEPGFLYPYLVEEADRVSWAVLDEGGATE